MQIEGRHGPGWPSTWCLVKQQDLQNDCQSCSIAYLPVKVRTRPNGTGALISGGFFGGHRLLGGNFYVPSQSQLLQQ